MSKSLQRQNLDRWLFNHMWHMPITRYDWAFVYEVSQEERTGIAWTVDPNEFKEGEQ